ncbi:hypothetical protein K1T71_000819 [Dendrolimus kikuchii]|uniref:Uncharacterized protein n=1 Tax=Dendrolimus kikuchii TaxID=765133 RepID=A0ACC1DL88_9NEOP|nr:hypothetical protein K1T71_000819 [Dendrolimus kikuchii]
MNLLLSEVSNEALNDLYKINFRPNLTQTQIKILNIDASASFHISNDDDNNALIPEISELKVELKEETVGKEAVLDEEFNSIQRNGFDLENDAIGDSNVTQNAKVIVEMDEHTPKTVLFLTDNKLNEDYHIRGGKMCGVIEG